MMVGREVEAARSAASSACEPRIVAEALLGLGLVANASTAYRGAEAVAETVSQGETERLRTLHEKLKKRGGGKRGLPLRARWRSRSP